VRVRKYPRCNPYRDCNGGAAKEVNPSLPPANAPKTASAIKFGAWLTFFFAFEEERGVILGLKEQMVECGIFGEL
jgi:hypothetical protein